MPEGNPAIRISQRGKKGKITAENVIAIKHKYLRSFIDLLPADNFAIEITASVDDWKILFYLALTYPEYLGGLIFRHLADPVHKQKLERLDFPPPRGKHAKGDQNFFREARTFAAAAYVIAEHWLKMPKEEWPDWFKQEVALIEKQMDESEILDCKNKKGGWRPLPLAAYLVENKFGVWKKKTKSLEDPIDLDYFKDDFLKQGKNSQLVAAKIIFKGAGFTVNFEQLAAMMT